MATLSERVSELATAIKNKFNAINPYLLPGGGSSGQVLTKTGPGAGDRAWANPAGGGAVSDINNVTYTWDFLSSSINADIWTGGAVNGGTIAATAESVTTNKHPGVALLRSSTTVGSGYRFASGISVTGTLVIAPGMTFTAVLATNAAEGLTYVGFINSLTATRSSNGAYFCINGDAIDAVCVSGGVETVHTFPALVNKNWYALEIVCNADNSITFNIFTEAGAIHATATITTNITSQKIGTGIVSTTTVAATTSMIYIDLLRLTINGIGRR